MKFLIYMGILAALFFNCSKATSADKTGWWKIDRIEIRKNDSLSKLIIPPDQYWNFYHHDSIRIFEHRRLQNCLQVQVSRRSIKCVDSSGNVTDEYFISKDDKQSLELYSTTILTNGNYTVKYYLDKVTDQSDSTDEMISP